MLKILFIGDISGKIGRETIKKILPKLKKDLKPNLVIANAENIAHGVGANEKTLKEVMEAGVDYFTSGDHAFDRSKEVQIYDNLPILRPANFPPSTPGKGYEIIEAGKHKLLLINLLGRVFMHMDYDCPFRKIDIILSDTALDKKNLSAIIVDIHAEATAEKIAIGHYLDNKVSAVLGTHTHVMTADSKVTKNGTAYITDVGMVGFGEGCIGVAKENIIKTFLTQIKNTHVIPETGKAIFNAVLVSIDPKTKKAKKIEPIIKHIAIK